jgi:hypothetical protein
LQLDVGYIQQVLAEGGVQAGDLVHLKAEQDDSSEAELMQVVKVLADKGRLCSVPASWYEQEMYAFSATVKGGCGIRDGTPESWYFTNWVKTALSMQAGVSTVPLACRQVVQHNVGTQQPNTTQSISFRCQPAGSIALGSVHWLSAPPCTSPLLPAGVKVQIHRALSNHVSSCITAAEQPHHLPCHLPCHLLLCLPSPLPMFAPPSIVCRCEGSDPPCSLQPCVSPHRLSRAAEHVSAVGGVCRQRRHEPGCAAGCQRRSQGEQWHNLYQ